MTQCLSSIIYHWLLAHIVIKFRTGALSFLGQWMKSAELLFAFGLKSLGYPLSPESVTSFFKKIQYTQTSFSNILEYSDGLQSYFSLQFAVHISLEGTWWNAPICCMHGCLLCDTYPSCVWCNVFQEGSVIALMGIIFSYAFRHIFCSQGYVVLGEDWEQGCSRNEGLVQGRSWV
jgi:hypothetical protein